MLRSRSFDIVNTTFEYDNNKFPKLKGSVGADLHGLEQDRAIRTDPDETRRRRTIRLIQNKQPSWGFTLQTYGIRDKRTQTVEIMSYVDYVEIDGAAWVAGMRRGDIILSVNGESVEPCTHSQLVNKIKNSRGELRLVVLFEDCCHKVELHERYLKLKKLLSQKVKELRGLEAEETKISQGLPLSRLDAFRQSTFSSSSSDWDIYSEIMSPSAFDSVPTNSFAFRNSCNQSESDISTDGSTNFADSITRNNIITIARNEPDLDCTLPVAISEKELQGIFPLHNIEAELDTNISVSSTVEVSDKADYDTLDADMDSKFSESKFAQVEDNICTSRSDILKAVNFLKTTVIASSGSTRPDRFDMEVESEDSSDGEDSSNNNDSSDIDDSSGNENLSGNEVNLTYDCSISRDCMNAVGHEFCGDYFYTTHPGVSLGSGQCEHSSNNSSKHTLEDVLSSPWLPSVDCQQDVHVSQEFKKNVCMVSANLTVPSQAAAPTTSALTHHSEATDVNNTKRLINGVLINDRNYSTRL